MNCILPLFSMSSTISLCTDIGGKQFCYDSESRRCNRVKNISLKLDFFSIILIYLAFITLSRSLRGR